MLVLLGVALYFSGVLGSVVGVTNTLDYSTDWDSIDGKTGQYSSEAYLRTPLPNGTELISFVVDYKFATIYEDTTKGNLDVKYEIFNFQTNSWETFHDRNWVIENFYRKRVSLKMRGTDYYNTGKPVYLGGSTTGERKSTKYFTCPLGMNVEEAKDLSGYTYSGSYQVTYQCIYPNQFVNIRDYKWDADRGWDIIYFPELHTFDKRYINENNIKLKTTVNIKSGGIQRFSEYNFGIDLWEVETNVIDTYQFDSVNCVYQPKYTYQVAQGDYFSKEECQLNNSLIECYKNSHCESQERLKATCLDEVCDYSKETIIDKIFPDKEEPTPEQQQKTKNTLTTVLIVIVGLLAIILTTFIIRRKK